MMLQDLIENFADWASLVKVWPLLAQGLLVTLELSAVALPLGLGFGLLIGLGCALGGRATRIALLCWIDLFRAFPVLVLLGKPFRLKELRDCVEAATARG